MKKLINYGQVHPNMAYIYALIGNSFLTLTSTFYKTATQTLTSFEAVALRSVCLILFNFYAIPSIQQPFYIKSSSTFRLVVKRLFIVATGQTLLAYCLSKIPVSTVATIFNTAPIFIFFIEAAAYKKSLNLVQLCLTLVSFSGVILIVQPQFLFGSHQEIQVQETTFCIFLMVIVGFIHAMNMHYVHKIAKVLNTFVNAYYSHFGFLFLSAIIANVSPAEEKRQITLNLVFIIIGLSISTIFTQYGIFLGNSLKSPSLVMPFGYVSVILGFLVDIYVFDTSFSWIHITGMLLTSSGLLSGYLMARDSPISKIQK